MNLQKIKKYDGVFFTATSSFFLLANLIGFGSSINSRLENEGSLPLHIYLHGICAFLWIVLYFIQTALIVSKNTQLHIKLGEKGFHRFYS